MKKLILILSVVALVFTLSGVAAAVDKELQFTWTHGGEADLAGFVITEMDGSGGPMIQEIPVPLVTSSHTETVTVPDGATTTRCYTIRAYDTAGNNSAESNEACKTFDYEGPSVPASFSVTIVVVP